MTFFRFFGRSKKVAPAPTVVGGLTGLIYEGLDGDGVDSFTIPSKRLTLFDQILLSVEPTPPTTRDIWLRFFVENKESRTKAGLGAVKNGWPP